MEGLAPLQSARLVDKTKPIAALRARGCGATVFWQNEANPGETRFTTGPRPRRPGATVQAYRPLQHKTGWLSGPEPSPDGADGSKWRILNVDTVMNMKARSVAFALLLLVGALTLAGCGNRDYVRETPVPPAPKPTNLR